MASALRRPAQLAPIALALLLGALVSAAAPPFAVAKVRVASPNRVTTLSGVVKISAHVSNPRRRLTFFIDGRRRLVRASRTKRWFVSSNRMWRYARYGYLNTRRLRNGRHRLVVLQRRRHGKPRRDSQVFRVRNRPKRPDKPPKLGPASVPIPAGLATWSSGFEGPSFRDWTTYERSDGGTFFPALGSREGIDALQGSGIAHFEVTSEESARGDKHSKLFKSWALNEPETNWKDDDGRPYERLPHGSPGGVYSAWYFLPSNYLKSSESWTNVLQFKESYLDSSGDWNQDPQWWIDMTRADEWDSDERPAGASGGDPVLVSNNWGEVNEDPRKVAAVPRGRWFEIRARVSPGERIDWFVDGAFWHSSPHHIYPVGFSKRRPVGWTFGVGHYGGIGKLWVDSVSFTAR